MALESIFLPLGFSGDLSDVHSAFPRCNYPMNPLFRLMSSVLAKCERSEYFYEVTKGVELQARFYALLSILNYRLSKKFTSLPPLLYRRSYNTT